MLQIISIYILCNLVSGIFSIDCYVCTSKNGSNPLCEDPFFRPAEINLQENCLTGMPNSNRSFRATHCLKLTAQGNGRSYVIRTCSLDNGSGIMSKEIVRVNHCGYLALKNFDEITESDKIGSFYGCLSACNSDGCNYANIICFNLFILITLQLTNFINYFSF